MSEKKKCLGGRRQTQRLGRQMSRADKTINTNEADDHMGRRASLRKDVPDNNRHINKYRNEIGLPSLEQRDQGLIAPEPADFGEVAIDEEADRELVNSDLIACIRLFDADEDGRPLGRETDEDSFCARHREVRRTRSRYKEIGGSLVEAGKEYTTRKEKSRKRAEGKRKATGVLKSIMVRLMPHEADMAGVLKEPQIAEAVDRVAVAYQESTGCEVISAAVHRMTNTDLHIHLQYCMVQAREEREREFARRVTAWKKKLTDLARETLRKEGNPNPGPVKVNKKKAQLLEERAIEPMPERGVVWQKVAGKRSMRDDSILGYSLRNKLNLVRAAEACEEHDLARKVALKNDYRSLCAPIAQMDDNKLNARYRDLWLERIWRSAIVALLPDPEKAVAKLKELGLDAARNYEAYGTTQVEVTHLNKRAEELKTLAAALEKERTELEASELDLQKREKLLEEQQMGVRQDRKGLEEEKAVIQKERDILAEERESLDKDRREFAERRNRLRQEEENIAQKESHLNSAITALDERASDLSKKENDLITRENAMRVMQRQNDQFKRDFALELGNLATNQNKLKADQLALEGERKNLLQVQRDAENYGILKQQVTKVLNLVWKLKEITKAVAEKTNLGKAISKLAELVGFEMTQKKEPDIGS